MNLTDLQQILKDRVKTAALEIFDVEIPEPNAEIPPKPELGDLAFAVSFELAKLIKQKTGEKQNPKAIAEKLKANLEDVELVDRVEIAGAGYINVFYNRPKLLAIFARAAKENKQRTASPS
jgi:arginyl-tRNA synthetase